MPVTNVLRSTRQNNDSTLSIIMTLYPKLITDALQSVNYPGSGKSIVELGMVDDNIRIDGNHVAFTLLFTKNPDPFAKSIVKAAQAAIRLSAGEDVEVDIQT